MTKVIIRKLMGALAMGAALVVPMLVPADAMAQGRHDRGDRHDNGKHRGWDKQDRRRDDRRNDDRRRDDWRRDQDRQRAERDRIAQMRRDQANRDRWVRSRNDDWRRRENDRRQQSKNQWRNLSYVGGAAGVYGLLTGNKTVAALGLGGGLYSLYRYEQDRKSQNRLGRDRYELFRRDSFDHGGHHYVRRTKNQGGQRYYYFARTR